MCADDIAITPRLGQQLSILFLYLLMGVKCIISLLLQQNDVVHAPYIFFTVDRTYARNISNPKWSIP